MKNLSRSYPIALTLLIAGCSGGGSSTPIIPNGNPNVNPTPTASPSGTVSPTPGTSASPGSANTAQITVTAPPRTAQSGTLTPVTSIVAVIKSINNNASIPGNINPTTVVAATGSNCSVSSNGEQCTFTLPAPAGTISAVITEYASATYVATGSFTFTSTGLAGQTQTFGLGGIAQNVAITLPPLSLDQASTQPLGLIPTDPSGAIIGGTTPFSEPLVLTDNDASGQTQLIAGQDNQTIGGSVTYTNPASVINLIYNGGAFGPGQINIVASGQPSEIATTSGYKKAPYHGN